MLNDLDKEQRLHEWYKILTSIPSEHTENNHYNTHTELTPIGDTLSTLYKEWKKEGKITPPTKGTSKYHR